MTERKRIVVTGATGFLGESFVAHLSLRPEFEVVAVHRHESATFPSSVSSNLVADFNDPLVWESLLANTFALVHLAGIASEATGGDFSRDNVEVTRTIATSAVGAGVSRFILLSSMSVFHSCPNDESRTPAMPVDPVDDYPRSKLAAEQALTAAAQSSTTLPIIVRPPMIVGSGGKGTFVSLAKACRMMRFSPFGAINNKYPALMQESLNGFLTALVSEPVDSGVFLPREPQYFSISELINASATARTGSATQLRDVRIPAKVLRYAMRVIGRESEFDHLAADILVDDPQSERLMHGALGSS